jgi:hypothetical protein
LWGENGGTAGRRFGAHWYEDGCCNLVLAVSETGGHYIYRIVGVPDKVATWGAAGGKSGPISTSRKSRPSRSFLTTSRNCGGQMIN